MQADALENLLEEIAACRSCSGMTPVPGRAVSCGSAPPVMVVGQAPAKSTGAPYLPFGNPGGGKNIFRWLEEVGWDEPAFRAIAYFTAVAKCYPGPNPRGKGDRLPSSREVTNCRPFLAQEQALIRPRILVPVGGLAVREILGIQRLADVVGHTLSLDGGVLAIPLPHPSGANLWNNDPAHRELRRTAVTALRDSLERLGYQPRSA